MAAKKRKAPAKKPAPRPDAERAADSELTLKVQRFIDALMGEAEGNGTKAARIAGFKGDNNTLATTAWQLRRKQEVRDAIEARLESDPLVLSRVKRLHLLSRMAEGKEGGKPADRLAALKMLGVAAGEASANVALSGGIDLIHKSTAELEAELDEEEKDEGDE